MVNENQISHIFSITAYKETPYLEECVKSLKNQTVESNIIMCTSTPCEYIRTIAESYDIPLYIRDGDADILSDWNYAYNCADSDYVTVVHQDDVYCADYKKIICERINQLSDPEQTIFYFTDYLPLKSKGKQKDINCRIRRLLRFPLRFYSLSKKRFIKKMILSFGNSICCPTVTYNKKKLGESIFCSDYKFNLDWDTFLRLSGEPGAFVYIDKPLLYYRIHDGATSKEFITNQLRVEEDTRMFCQFWPKWFAKFIMIFYKKAYDTYNT